jgi:2-polyprenyl-6-hydroxyphenyl methylase/3-demethylubiquinone-9 3-methyltransferase
MKNGDAATLRLKVGTTGRFAFGKNWRRFLGLVNEGQIAAAELSLKQMLNLDNLKGKTFLDAGSGSGLFSLAARHLGAKVFSFDYDPDSVACTLELKRKFCSADQDWCIEPGSALDRSFLNGLGNFDVVYSWGVLHHTGDMWNALENMSSLVKPGGKLFIAIYND